MFKVELRRIIKITAGRFHCWCESNIGRIRKPNAAVPQDLWNEFEKGTTKMELTKSIATPGQNWYQRLWCWFKNIIKKIYDPKRKIRVSH